MAVDGVGGTGGDCESVSTLSRMLVWLLMVWAAVVAVVSSSNSKQTNNNKGKEQQLKHSFFLFAITKKASYS